MSTLATKLPQDDAGARVMRFDGVRGGRYAEIFLVDGDVATQDLTAGIYNTIGLNDADGTGDTCPQAVLDMVDLAGLKAQYEIVGAFKNAPRLWCLDWLEGLIGQERDFNGLQARWVMWLDVPEGMLTHEAVPYKQMTGKRDTELGIRAGSPAFILDDPDGDSWCMKSASLMIDADQTYESLKDLGSRLTTAPGWSFRAVELAQDLVLTPEHGTAKITQDELGNTYDRVGGPYSNYKP